MSTTAVIYGRISQDPTGLEAGVTRQREDAVAFCKARKWPVVDVLIDNDISASRYSRKRRPGWARVLELVDQGAANAIVAWDLDRMLRQPRELEDLIDRADHGLVVLTLQGQIDLSTADGRAMARVMVAMAAKASDDTSRRVRRAKAAKAAAGLPMGNVSAFGWTDNGMTVVEDEADAIREAARRVIAGEGITAIARDWSAKRYRRPRGASAWSSTTVRNVLTSPRNAALVVHRGEVVGDAEWPAIVDRATHERLVAILNDPARRVGARRRGEFTGVFRCSRCGNALTRDSAKGKVVWRCRPTPGSDACGRTSITGEHVEPTIVEAVIRAVDAGTLRDVGEKPADDSTAALTKLEARLTELAELFADGTVSRREWMAARRKIEEGIKAARAKLATTRRSAALDPYRGRSLRAAWDTFTAEQRNVIIRAVVDRVVVHPSSMARPKPFDRLEIVWAA